MKKKKLKNLSLNKKRISNLETKQLHGGHIPSVPCTSLTCGIVVIYSDLNSCWKDKTMCGCGSIP